MLKESQNQQIHTELTGKLLDTLRTKPEKEVSGRKNVFRIYSALSPRREDALQAPRSKPSSEKNENSRILAINKNTANRHGRT